MPINLGSGAISGAYVGSNAVTAAYLGGTSVFAAGGSYTPITPITDSIARFYLPAGTTSFSAGVGTSSGRFYLTDGTSTTFSQNPQYAYGMSTYYQTYYTQASYTHTISGMSSSAPKVVQIVSCNYSGNPYGTINAIRINTNTTDIDAVDISGLGTLFAFTAFTSTAYDGTNYDLVNGPSSSQTSSIKEVRAVGTTIAHPQASAYSYYGSMRYNSVGGLDITGHLLDANALDQLYTDLGDSSGNSGYNALKVRGNPGVGTDTPSIATAKNYTVYGS